MCVCEKGREGEKEYRRRGVAILVVWVDTHTKAHTHTCIYVCVCVYLC
jgi:hypothetical protein